MICEVCKTSHGNMIEIEKCLQYRLSMVNSNLEIHGFKSLRSGNERKK